MIEKALGLFHLMLFGSLLISLERIFTSLTDSVFNKASNLYFEWQWQNLFLFADCDKVCFRRASGIYYKWRWWSLWQSLFLSPRSRSLF